LLPQALPTLLPGLLLLVGLRSDPRVRAVGLALVGWIALGVLPHVALGYLGYSKLLRYVVLVTPAAILLFALTSAEALGRARKGGPGRRILLTLAAVGLLLEVSLGVQYVLLYPRRALIVLWPDRALMRSMMDSGS
jgi:hypothetical protein